MPHAQDRYATPIPPPKSRPGWPKIWGFDLGELSFSAFSSKAMFDKRWHLRRERFSTSRLVRQLPVRWSEATRIDSADSRYSPFPPPVPVAYQAAMMNCLAAECTATYSLSKCAFLLLPQLGGIWSSLANLTRRAFLARTDEDLQDHVEDRFAPAHLYNNDIIDMQITTIVLCVAVACLYGADFFL